MLTLGYADVQIGNGLEQPDHLTHFSFHFPHLVGRLWRTAGNGLWRCPRHRGEWWLTRRQTCQLQSEGCFVSRTLGHVLPPGVTERLTLIELAALLSAALVGCPACPPPPECWHCPCHAGACQRARRVGPCLGRSSAGVGASSGLQTLCPGSWLCSVSCGRWLRAVACCHHSCYLDA